ncbi:MAG: hypothetical protein SF182_13635 [Deltaproteobacteria bacterium]|nr:hypothetical protein [Deltaproteobacteria bacterium]
MTLAAKQRLVVAVLAVLAVWPIAHRALVVHARIDPWRFFGWAMYCTPKLPVTVEARASYGRARVPLVTGSLPPPLQRAIYRFSHRRAQWGTFERPDRLAARLLADQRDADAIEILVRHWYLDAPTATIKEARYTYRYGRDGMP